MDSIRLSQHKPTSTITPKTQLRTKRCYINISELIENLLKSIKTHSHHLRIKKLTLLYNIHPDVHQ